MAPNNEVLPHTIDRTPEYVDFLEKLREYHATRGTTFDAEPKVGTTHLDLYKVFNHIVANGGYDKVSEEKLAWRRMASELGIVSTNEASTAFSLKEKFYKNLAAYEIKTIHGKEPPPKDILEDVTAKGAGLLTRTRENFRGYKRDSNIGLDSAASGDDGTPVRDRPIVDTPVSSSRASRGLREAPPQRVIFQPDTGPTRSSTRHTSSQQGQTVPTTPANIPGASHQTPHTHQAVQPPQAHRLVHGASGFYSPNSENASILVSSYAPRAPMALPLRPVDTPGNNAAVFTHPKPPKYWADFTTRPYGVPFDGSNIYIRCLNSLRSSIPSERAFALNHFLKISFERGDKFKFDSFPGLSEGLVENALSIGSLFYDVDWKISYEPRRSLHDSSILDGNLGTPDILERIQKLKHKDVQDEIQTEEFANEMIVINEAVLTIRNMVTLPENAFHMSDFAPMKDLICIILHLPDRDSVIELKGCALDIAEHITPFMTLESEDPFYKTLLAQLQSEDRGVILTALRALARISVSLDATNRLGNVPVSALRDITNWLLLSDDELLDACLDFLYQYTAVISNVDSLLRSSEAGNLVHHLARLLSHGARRIQDLTILKPETKTQAKDVVAPMPPELLKELLKFEEPERVHRWVKCFFEEDGDSYITQLTAWQAYQNGFISAVKAAGQALITPADFIRNSTRVYKGSTPQVLREPGEMQKFIVHGIRSREIPLNIDGKPFRECRWVSHITDGKTSVCNQLFASKESMRTHVFESHLKLSADKESLENEEEIEEMCRWQGCNRFGKRAKTTQFLHAKHISTHVGQLFSASANADSAAKVAPSSYLTQAETMSFAMEETATKPDEKNPNVRQLAGIPLSAILILQNIARNTPKTDAEEELRDESEDSGWNDRLFIPIKERLFQAWASNRAMPPYVSSLMSLIEER